MKESDLSSYSSESEEIVVTSAASSQNDHQIDKMNKHIEDREKDKENEFVEIDLSNVSPPIAETQTNCCSCKRNEKRNMKMCMRLCGESCKSFYCGHDMSYFACVLTR